METFGLFEAKTHLSEYAARAEAGDHALTMRHNKAVAQISSLSSTTRSARPEHVLP